MSYVFIVLGRLCVGGGLCKRAVLVWRYLLLYNRIAGYGPVGVVLRSLFRVVLGVIVEGVVDARVDCGSSLGV